MKPVSIFALALFATQLFAATPAEIAIKQGLANVQQEPGHYAYYGDLAMAYARRARETGDPEFYTRAEETLQKGFAIAPGNYEGLKVETWLELCRHEYAKALETATKLNKMMPDDLAVYGYLSDANAELGHYTEAVDATQWMLNLRPGNTGGLLRASYLRELHGNIQGALELMQSAYDATPLAESEDRAWILTQTAHLQYLAGDLAKAEAYANAAMAAFPDYHAALAVLGQVRIAQKSYPEAVRLLSRRYQAAPAAESLYALAEAQELAGQHDEAAISFSKFEADAQAQSGMARNANRQLISYYVDHAHDPAKALAIARREIARQQDVLTVDSYAWALAANGDYQAAQQQISKPLAMGVKDPELKYHAGVIAGHLHRTGGEQ